MKPVRFILSFLFLAISSALIAQQFGNPNKFKQLEELATPNTYRTASGAPGHEYWQQRADYDIDIALDDNEQKIYGEEKVTYYNNSPDELATYAKDTGAVDASCSGPRLAQPTRRR